MVNAFYLDTQSFNSILSQLRKSSLISNISPIGVENSVEKNRGCTFAFAGQIQVGEQCVSVRVGLDERFPLSLPMIFLVPWNALGFIPHVLEWSGYVCYVQNEGLLLDRHNPVGIVEEALARAISTLASGICGDNRMDFVDEFESYWSRLNGVERILSFVKPSQVARKIIAAKSTNETLGSYAFLGDDVSTVRACLNNDNLKSHTHRNALYVPFREGTFIKPPYPGEFWVADQIREVVYSNLSQDNIRRLKKLVNKWKREEVVIFGLPRPSGEPVLFGIHYTGVENCHPLFQGGRAQHLTPIVLDRCDKEYLLPRGGASIKLQKKRLALIGCGSVGGFIALELIRAGVLDLTLIDYDTLTPENTFRHVLGKEAWGKLKVKALSEEIDRKFPYVQTQIIAERVEKILTTGAFEPNDYDLIIVALGDDTVSLYLNEVLYSKTNAPPIVFTWLEPYGIGGHALLTGNLEQRGCLECLFTPIPGNDDNPIYNRASFAASGQSFAKDISGCGSLFIPYGSIDAVQTAVLASRLATEVLLGEISGNPLLSWKGNAREFLRAGFKLSGRYSLTQKELFEQRYAYYNSKCSVCGITT